MPSAALDPTVVFTNTSAELLSYLGNRFRVGEQVVLGVISALGVVIFIICSAIVISISLGLFCRKRKEAAEEEEASRIRTGKARLEAEEEGKKKNLEGEGGSNEDDGRRGEGSSLQDPEDDVLCCCCKSWFCTIPECIILGSAAQVLCCAAWVIVDVAGLILVGFIILRFLAPLLFASSVPGGETLTWGLFAAAGGIGLIAGSVGIGLTIVGLCGAGSSGERRRTCLGIYCAWLIVWIVGQAVVGVGAFALMGVSIAFGASVSAGTTRQTDYYGAAGVFAAVGVGLFALIGACVAPCLGCVCALYQAIKFPRKDLELVENDRMKYYLEVAENAPSLLPMRSSSSASGDDSSDKEIDLADSGSKKSDTLKNLEEFERMNRDTVSRLTTFVSAGEDFLHDHSSSSDNIF